MSVHPEVEVLLVEDNPADVELTLRAFRARNFANQVFVARDGAEALVFFFGEEGEGHPLKESGVTPRTSSPSPAPCRRSGCTGCS